MISTLYIPSWFTITSSLSVFGWNKTILQQKYSVEEFFDLDAAGLEYIFSVFNIFRYVWYSKPPCGSCFYCPVEYFECMSWMSPNDDDHGDDDYDDPYSMVMITKCFWSYILTAKKFAEPVKKKLRKKCINPGVTFGLFGVILGHFGYFLGHFGSF